MAAIRLRTDLVNSTEAHGCEAVSGQTPDGGLTGRVFSTSERSAGIAWLLQPAEVQPAAAEAAEAAPHGPLRAAAGLAAGVEAEVAAQPSAAVVAALAS